MIDLTKPMRRKPFLSGGGQVIHAVKGHGNNVLVEWANGEYLGVYSVERFEGDYENIPEPRKPQRWVIGERSRVAMPIDEGGWHPMPNAQPYIYVIEWPEGAPLPEWPNGE